MGCYLMQTDVKYLDKPIRVNDNPISLTYRLGKPLIKLLEETRDTFVFKDKNQFFDFVYCTCGMLI